MVLSPQGMLKVVLDGGPQCGVDELANFLLAKRRNGLNPRPYGGIGLDGPGHPSGIIG